MPSFNFIAYSSSMLFFAVFIILPVFIVITVKKQKAAGEAAKKRAEAFKENEAENEANAVKAKNAQNAAFASENRGQAVRSYTVRDGKPYYSHSISECTGGSIHDGYHEGSFKPIAPGVEGKAVKSGEGYSASETVIRRQNGAEVLLGSVGKLSPAARGIVLAEIIGKPKALR